ncbi:DNA methyltransferase [Synergistales bacterium]|nr:DNA methyltransferase [Synergistales bacterium]
MPFYTPLRYPGGKRKLYELVRDIIKFNRLEKCAYVEPYAGGAGLALSLLFNDVVGSIYLNDFSRPLFAFWDSVLNHTGKFCDLIENTPVTMDEWYKQKAIQDNSRSAMLLKLGFSTFFLNRTNRSGILKGGVVGGKKQDGAWKLDARFSKKNLIKRIKDIAAYRGQIFIENMDAQDYLKAIVTRLNTHASLIYFDPPYYEKGAALYDNFYNKEDHASVAKDIQALPFHWIVSYDNQPEIQYLYQSYEAITYSFYYTAQNKKPGSEFMTISPTLSFCKFSDSFQYHTIRDLKKVI